MNEQWQRESNEDPQPDFSTATDDSELRQSFCRNRLGAQRYVTENESLSNECPLTSERLVVHDQKPNALRALRRISLPYLILLSLSILALRTMFAPQELLHPVTKLFCRIPAISSMPLCGYVPPESLLVDFRLLGKAQSNAIDLLIGESLGNSELVLKIAKAEMAADDLASAVSLSDLTSRDSLAGLLGGFARSAGMVAEELQELHAQIVGTANM